MSIVLSQSQTRWHWSVLDDEGEVLHVGSAADYIDACRAALSYFDAARAGT